MADNTKGDKVFVIIDGNSLLNRAYYAVSNPMISSKGVYTHGIYGFLLMLRKILSDYEPGYIAVAFDRKAPTFRHREYSEYKAGRKPMPLELAMQFDPLKDILRAMRISILEMDGYEADDLMGTLAKRGESMDMEPLLITGDKDALQLASEKTKVLITKKGTSDFDLYDAAKMREVYGFEPEVFVDLKGLMGDSSDNLPGIPGVGEKKGLKLLEDYESLDAVLAHADEIPGKLGENVRNGRESALMSRHLARIETEVPIDENIEDMRLKDADTGKLRELYIELGFNSLLGKLGAASPAEPEVVPAELELSGEISILDASNREKLGELKEELEKSDMAAVKVFGNNDHKSRPVLYGISIIVNKKLWYLDMAALSLSADELAGLLKGLKVYGHIIKSDIFMLMSYIGNDITILIPVFDTAVAEYLIDPSAGDYHIKRLALKYFAIEISDDKEFFSANAQFDMLQNYQNKYADYALQYLGVSKALMDRQRALMEERGLWEVFTEVELPLISVLASLEYEGFPFDPAILNDVGAEIDKGIERLTADIYSITGEEFNINSPKQIGEVLFEHMQLPYAKKTKKGYATGAEILEKLAPDHPVASKIIEYRTIAKLKSTYIDGLVPLQADDGRIHAHFQQTVAATGRLSCTEPNLQNIPVRQEYGRQIRRAFVSGSDEYILLAADYSQIELRILAHMSGDKSLMGDFMEGADIHKRTAARVFGIDEDEVSFEQRGAAKAVNFGIIYGMSSFGLSEGIGVTLKEAEGYINEYFEKHPDVKRFLDSCVTDAKTKGYSVTLLGRRRAIPEISASNYMLRQAGERLAMNTPIQGSAADIIKLAMIAVKRSLEKSELDAQMILQVHDELILRVFRKDAEAASELLKREMEGAYKLAVPLTVGINSGDNWYELK